MSFTNLIRVAIRAILSNKSRTLLSTLGIIIGVAAVIIMMSIGQGSKESIRKEISKMGSNVITVRPGADMRGGVRQDPSAMQTLKMSDYESMLSGLKYVQHVSPEVTQAGQVVNGNNNTTTTIYGEAPEYMTIKLWTVQEGDCFTDEDVRKNAKVCVIGKTVADELFPGGQNPIGRSIRFKNIPFRVVGVLKSKGYNNWGMDQDNLIIAPYTTVMKRIAAQTYFSSISVSALSEELSEKAIEELTALLRANHKIKDGADDDFTIRSQQEIMETMSTTMDTVTLILVVAAAFSLLVAGIGIMNIMLVSVTERTKEIGLRMSVGARGRDISRQFLFESIIISLSGGLIGIGVGYLGSWAAQLMMLPASVPLWSVLLSFGVCACIGLIFGYVPARKAALMDPIEALRYE
ncbi:MAG: ABC transporter permease [Bacteroidaceae bacterium]|nr:ABC transporter permease [Bacteroidaceae bacterium]MBR7052932.1 ABC transporter permease [Bacteroidaceae bacterium]